MTTRQYHDEAMEEASIALRHKRAGKLGLARPHFEKAHELEAKAAALLPPQPEMEPTRAILYRSAAWLAYNCDRYEDALNLAIEGLRGHVEPGKDSGLMQVAYEAWVQVEIDRKCEAMEQSPEFQQAILKALQEPAGRDLLLPTP